MSDDQASELEKAELAERSSVTTQPLGAHWYTATAGTLVVGVGESRAEVFYVSYVLDVGEDRARRPVAFVFNGGPGSASAWLHLGLFGPRRVAVPEDLDVAPPYEVGVNPHTLLFQADLVFVDPVSTGFSRTASDDDARQFHGIEQDVECFARLILLWCTRNGRWLSPKFLAGESYGTTRAVELAAHLQDRHGMTVNGLVLISAILNFATARCEPGNDIAFALALPTYAAAAHHHERVAAPSLEALAADVEDFALNIYLPTLLRGSRVTRRERDRLVRMVSSFSGLSRPYVEQCCLRVAPGRFRKELLRASRLVIGRFDARYAAVDWDAAAAESDHDPSHSAVRGPFTAAVNEYLRGGLGYEEDAPYEILNHKAVQPWDVGDHGRGRYVDATRTLRSLLERNHGLGVFLASGYHDVATPYFASEWSLDHMALDGEPSARIEAHRYPGGHMMYLREPELGTVAADIAEFVLRRAQR